MIVPLPSRYRNSRMLALVFPISTLVYLLSQPIAYGRLAITIWKQGVPTSDFPTRYGGTCSMATFAAHGSLPAVPHEADAENSPTRHLSPTVQASTVYPSVPLSNLAEPRFRNVLDHYLRRPRKSLSRAAPDTATHTGIPHYALMNSMPQYSASHAVQTRYR